MKKIIATVLAMVMALALCATAFAADGTALTGVKAYRKTNEAAAVATGDMTTTFWAATAATLDKDGKQINEANVAYYVFSDTKTYTVVSSLAEADLVLYSDTTAKNVMLYLAESVVKYKGTGTVFTNFGDKCGQFNLPNYDKTKTYYTSNSKFNGVEDKALYVADDDGAIALMVGGKLVNVTKVADNATATVQHSYIPTVKDGKVTGYTCPTCKLAAVKAPNVASIPSDAQVISGTWYFPAAAASTTTTTSSPKTFDAGIAMYVGMALTSVAGSAVVIGKKKEF